MLFSLQVQLVDCFKPISKNAEFCCYKSLTTAAKFAKFTIGPKKKTNHMDYTMHNDVYLNFFGKSALKIFSVKRYLSAPSGNDCMS